MTRAGLLRTIACIAALGGALATVPACDIGVEGADYPVAYGDYPAGCIATTEAVYYDGYPSYWCGGLWYFRGEGGRWGHYGREPPGLYQHRMGAGPDGGTTRPRVPPEADVEAVDAEAVAEDVAAEEGATAEAMA